MIQIPIPLIPTEEGVLLIPAEQVTALLRRVAADWMDATDAEETDADPQTVLAMTGVLNRLADQIDAECIACTPPTGEEP